MGPGFTNRTIPRASMNTDVGTPRSFGQPLIINIHSVNLNVAYAASDRFNLRVTVPVSYGSQSRFYADTARTTSPRS